MSRSGEDQPAASPGGALNAAESQAVVAQVVHAQMANLPLPQALRAAGAAVQGRRVRRALADVATRLEQGQPLDAALAQSCPAVPTHVGELIRIAATDARGGELLSEYVEHQRRADILRREIRGALGYPLAILAATLVVTVVVPSLFMDSLMETYREFHIEVPRQVYISAWIGHWGPTFLVILTLASLLVAAVTWWGLGPARCRGLLARIPLLGPVLRSLEIAGWARALKLLLAGGLPLSEALRRTADVARDATFSAAVLQVADRVEGGTSLAGAVADEELFPASLVTFLEHGERNRLLPASLEGIARVCEERARQRTRWFRLTFPALVFVMVAHCVIFSYGNALRPLINVLRSFQ